MSSIMFIDLETQNHPYYGSVASPYCPDNYVVEAGWRIDRVVDGSTVVGDVQSVRYSNRSNFLAARLWLDIPDDCWLIVAHNAAYEISWFLQHNREKFEAFLKRGGRVYCTMHGEYLVTDQQSQYPSLDETAPKYGGTHKVDGVKILWESGVLTSEIDPILLHEYLCGPNGDVVNTALCFYGQVQEFGDRMTMVWERMDGMLAFAYMEWFGLWVDKPTAEANQAKQEAEILELKATLEQYLPEDLPEALVFNWGSLHHMSALMYGGAIKYRRRGSYVPTAYIKDDFYMDAVGNKYLVSNYTSTNPEDPPVALPDNLVTYKSGKNKGLPKVFRLDTDVEKLKWVDDEYTFTGIVDIKSLPKVVQEKFDYSGRRKGEFVTGLDLPDGTPVLSTSADAMHILASFGYDFVKDCLKLAALEKDTGTYYLREIVNAKGEVTGHKGMLQFVIPMKQDGSGIVHHRLNTCAAVTGRLTSSTPNLQNLPRSGTSKVKEMFKSRYGAGGKITEVDYSALEVVMGCVFSGDVKLLQLLQEGTDMHCYRLAFKLGEAYESVYEKCHTEDHPEYAKYYALRTKVKTPSFAAQYGASPMGIVIATGCTMQEAEEFLENEAKLFPDTIKFRSVVRAEVERTGMMQGSARMEYDDDGKPRTYRTGYYQAPSGMRYRFRQYLRWVDKADGTGKEQVMDYKDTEIANYWNQGEAFFMMVVAAGMVLRHMLSKNWYDNQVCLVTNVHDALYLDSANNVVGREASLAVKSIMERARERMLKLFPNYGILDQVQFPAAAEMGDSMYDKHHVE